MRWNKLSVFGFKRSHLFLILLNPDRAVYPRGCVFAFLPPSEKYSAPFVLGRICSKWKRLQNGHIQTKVLLLAPLNAGIASPIVFVYANSSATLSTSSFLCSVQGTITEHADGRERFTLSVRDTAIVLSHRKSRLLAARLDDQATIQTAPSVSKEVPDEKLSYSIVRRERALGGDRYLVRTDEEPCWLDKKDLPDEVILKWKRHPKAKTKKKIPAPTTPKISTGRGRSRSDTQSWIAAIRQILLSAEGGLPTSQILSAFQENYPEKMMERKGDVWKSFIRDILRQEHRVFFSKRDRSVKGKPIVWALTVEARSEAVQLQQRQAVAEKPEDNALTDLDAAEMRKQTAGSATEPLEETHHANALLPEREMLVPQGPADDSAVLFKPCTPDPLLFDDFFTAQPDSLVLLPQETLSTQLEQVADQSTEQLEVIESDLPPAQPDPTLLYLHGADVVDEVQKAAPAAIQVPTPVESGRAQDGTTAAESTTEPLVPSDLEKELPSEIVDLVALEFEPTIDTGIDNPELQRLGEKLLAKFPPQEVQEEFLANLAKKAEKSLAGPVGMKI